MTDDEANNTEMKVVGYKQDRQAYDTFWINGGISSEPAQVLTSFC